MRTYKLLTLSLLLSTTAFGCTKDEDEPTATATATVAMTTGDAPTTGATGTTGETPPTTTDPTTGDPTTGDPTTGDPTTGGGDPFVFDETPPENLAQVDRMGMPAVATAVISAGMKDAYNEATPVDDAASKFAPDIIANITGLHAALDDDLIGLKLTPCDPGTSCVAQGAPLVLPDTLKVDVATASGFPNGRRLADPVIDVTLAVIFLDLSVHAVDTFANLPLNPSANDKEFLPDFPYLATPH
jgi:hypothetical protein